MNTQTHFCKKFIDSFLNIFLNPSDEFYNNGLHIFGLLSVFCVAFALRKTPATHNKNYKNCRG